MTTPLPFAKSCEQNKKPILAVLKEQLSEPTTVLEIGSGTGQHAVYFAQTMPHLRWQPSDRPENLPAIQAWIEHQGGENVLSPIALDVGLEQWPSESYDVIFSANAVHIMSWRHVISMFRGLASVAADDAKIILYGPFNYDNQYTSASNRTFDAYLKRQDMLSGIRNFEDLDVLAAEAGFSLLRDYPMPANNRVLVWSRST